ncbi:hypothetical protein J6590_058035 [Homalodisca vitripennis]|nr:hypothetical protein J6590_058035 [Homalodisca vitripennis]
MCWKEWVLWKRVAWQGLRRNCELAGVVIKILGASVTYAGGEQPFIIFGWIHSKRAEKLTYLAYKRKLMRGTPERNLQNKTDETLQRSQGKGEEGAVFSEEQMVSLEL